MKVLPKIIDGQMLKYHSTEHIVLIDTKAEDVTCSEGETLTFVQEPQNQHDPYAIIVCHQTKYQIGYMPRGNTQDITNQWINKNGLIIGFISEVNEEYDRILFEIGLYKPINEFQHQFFKLEKIRQENMQGYINGIPTTVRLYRGKYAVFNGKTRLGEIYNADSFMQGEKDTVGILTNVNCNDGKYTADVEVYI
ncbi:MAG TPA: hypothetical protein DD413_07575 [Ruminococcus sp.]|nr:hypothetical protein [Ruminococcus sp.]